jgi:pimeloyl-ACP methyl ester carboxylesterase
MREAAQKYGLDVEIVNFAWDRDPEHSEQATADFQKKMLEMASDQSMAGRPVYVIAHSWGTVLMHDALNKLDEQGKPFHVRRFVTMGSPIVPSRFFVWAFKEIEDLAGELQKTVRRPAGIEKWNNLWAGYDSFSGVIDVADDNVRVDIGAIAYARRLEALLKTDQKKQAQADLKVLGSSGDWHESYRCAFATELKSLGETVRWDPLGENTAQVLPVQP